MDEYAVLAPERAAEVLENPLAIYSTPDQLANENAARLVAAEALRRQIPMGSPAKGDPEESIHCGGCFNDVSDAVLEDYSYCPYCGQKF